MIKESQRNKVKKRLTTDIFLHLTPMIDMFTIILLFLLKSYSVSEFQMTPPKDVNLPTSLSKTAPQLALVVSASPTGIFIEGEKVATIYNGVLNPYELDGLVIKPLLAKLNRYGKISKYKQSQREDFTFTGNILLQADRTLPFSIIKRIMFTAEHADFSLFKFAVLKIE